MSTFDGIVHEFPDIRIDHFRTHADRRPPAVCFLSHVHSDHLLGLESLKMPFVYCSNVTRNLLLRMEKYPHRINFQKGILEARRQTYRHLKSILRPLPLETPVELELTPSVTIRVTLFDANHCPGAVMFLIEGDGKAILYTGDVRAESWWVNAVVRNPILLPYVSGQKSLDGIYLDTTFASPDDIHRHFPSKAEGLIELLTTVDKCPPDTIFYFRAWTLGYEDVWVALANHLRGRVHVDDYQLGLYASFAEHGPTQASPLMGVQVGNSIHPGYLTDDVSSLIHSCEPGMDCHGRLRKKSNVVWITPIISRCEDGSDFAEIGAGGGFGDLQQVCQLENVDDTSIQALRSLCTSLFRDGSQWQQVQASLEALTDSKTLHIPLAELGLNQQDEVTLKDFVASLSQRNASQGAGCSKFDNENPGRPTALHFPYSRHSSFSELHHLVSRFKPKDICPCTVDLTTWTEGHSMESLFGDVCSEKVFNHDVRTRRMIARLNGFELGRKRKRQPCDSQETASQDSNALNTDNIGFDGGGKARDVKHEQDSTVIVIEDTDDDGGSGEIHPTETAHEKSMREVMSDVSLPNGIFDSQGSVDGNPVVLVPADQCEKYSARKEAYLAARSCLRNGESSDWDDLRNRSLGWKGHTEEESIL